ncbi:MAG: hypothetical protein MNPFHGCM_03055 [Gemmatimonadaceae bacterium]|nr:hypothetical protein [Gemmatimonadaceae bacterium]
MVKLNWRTPFAVSLLALGACYHQVVETGLPAGTQTVSKPWTPTWIFGLVPATPIDVRSTCRSGVAFVDTKMSFANGLVSGLTIGIFTPRSVVVTCAAQSAANGATRIDVSSTTDDALEVALSQAEAMSRAAGHGVYVVFPTATAETFELTMGGAR